MNYFNNIIIILITLMSNVFAESIQNSTSVNSTLINSTSINSVKDFIGNINLLTGALVGVGGSLVAQYSGQITKLLGTIIGILYRYTLGKIIMYIIDVCYILKEKGGDCMSISKLKLERMNRGVKQWRLASLVGITQAELSSYEIGRRRCPAHIRYKLAEKLQVKHEQLFPDQKEEVEV